MIRVITLAGFALVLLVSCEPAHAVSLTATAANPLASGTFEVTVAPQGGNVFAFTVTGNPDGRTGPTGGPVKHSVVDLSIGFMRGDFSSVAPESAGSSGSTSSGGTYVGANWYTVAHTDALHFDSPGALFDLAPFAENSFSSIVRLSSPDPAERVAVTLHGGTQQWFAQGLLPQDVRGTALAPEPGSLALALPGALPLLLWLRRRRAC